MEIKMARRDLPFIIKRKRGGKIDQPTGFAPTQQS